jgi:hypothetical protein
MSKFAGSQCAFGAILQARSLLLIIMNDMKCCFTRALPMAKSAFEMRRHEKNHTFTFMGTGAGCGVPAFFCDCPACEEARRDPRAQRGDCGVMITGAERTLIDAPPTFATTSTAKASVASTTSSSLTGTTTT